MVRFSNRREFRFKNKAVIIVAEKVGEIRYKFITLVEGERFNEYEEDVNGLEKALDAAVEHIESLILMNLK